MVELRSLWQKSQICPMVNPNGVHVWCATRQELMCDKALFRSFLHPLELNRAEKYVFPHDRERFILFRGFLRYLLGQYINLPADKISFDYSVYGKPEITKSQNNHEIYFNVSDSQDLMLFAISQNKSVGVDVEFMRDNMDIVGIAEKFFSIHELDKLKTTDAQNQLNVFFQIWTRKEALIKNIGLGLHYPLQEINVLNEISVDVKTGVEYRVLSLPIAEYYQAALAVDKTMLEDNINYYVWSG